ncbi:MAG: hypothetical protein QXT25_01770 [Candidatus Anstonellaceae archaeon]
MIILECSSLIENVESLVETSKRLGDVLLLSSIKGRTAKELEACFALAKKAFKSKTNISQSIPNEAMLFLAKETNFSSAVKKIGVSDPADFILVAERSIPIGKIKKELSLVKAKPVCLPAWGKKRRGYFEADLAIESMALRRISD